VQRENLGQLILGLAVGQLRTQLAHGGVGLFGAVKIGLVERRLERQVVTPLPGLLVEIADEQALQVVTRRVELAA
jgi:hypothetical protein